MDGCCVDPWSILTSKLAGHSSHVGHHPDPSSTRPPSGAAPLDPSCGTTAVKLVEKGLTLSTQKGLPFRCLTGESRAFAKNRTHRSRSYPCDIDSGCLVRMTNAYKQINVSHDHCTFSCHKSLASVAFSCGCCESPTAFSDPTYSACQLVSVTGSNLTR